MPSNQNQCKRAKGHMAPRPFVLRASRCRFAAARRAGASMQMSRVMQQSFNRTFKSKLPTTHKANCMATVGFRQLHNNCWGGLLHQHSCRNMSQYCDHMMSFVVRCLRLRAEHAGAPIVVSRGTSFASLHRGFVRCKHCCVSQLFSHRFAAAGHVGALMSMSRVVVLVHLGLPCWCDQSSHPAKSSMTACWYVDAQRTKRGPGRQLHRHGCCSMLSYCDD